MEIKKKNKQKIRNWSKTKQYRNHKTRPGFHKEDNSEEKELFEI